MKQKRSAASFRWSGAFAALTAFALVAPLAFAEKADKDKPTQIEADRMSADDARRISIFDGNVVLTKGTILLRADRITVRQDSDGFQISTAIGKPARFRQKKDGKDEWIEGEAMQIRIDDRNEKIELRDHARILRGKDEVKGDTILVDTRAEFFSVIGGQGNASAETPRGRVRAVIQPKASADESEAPMPKKPGG